jgi:hypothetical protein
MAKVIRDIGPRKVIAVVTDGASNMNVARRMLVQQQDMTHIIEMRCEWAFMQLLLTTARAVVIEQLRAVPCLSCTQVRDAPPQPAAR